MTNVNLNNSEKDFLVEKIRTQYTEKQHTELDELKALDKKVKRPVNVFGYVFGTISALVMGFGMSLVMTDIGQTLGVASPFVSGIIVGIVGMLMAIANVPVCKGILAKRKKMYSQQIISLSNKISKN